MKTNKLDGHDKEWQYRSIFDTAADGLIVDDLETGCVVEANPKACSMHGYSREEFIGKPLIAFIHPDSQILFNEFVKSFQSDEVFDRRIQNVHKDGSIFFTEWRGTMLTFKNRPCFLGVLRDVSKRILAEQILHERIELRNHEQTKLLEISHILASTLEFQPALILDELQEIVASTHSGIFALVDNTLGTLAMRGTLQLEQASPIQIQLKGPETMAILFDGQRPVRIADVWGDDPKAVYVRSLLENGAARLLDGIASWMWVPLAVRGRIIGCVGLAETQKAYFSPHHADLALSVANQAAIAMVNAELNKQAQENAVSEERQRLARDLHDAINQSLFSAGLIAEVLPRLWERDQTEARRSLEDLRRLTRGAQAEMRALLAELRPATLTDSNLGDLLHLLGNAFSGRTNIPVAVTVAGEYILPTAVQVAFYRVCQEALFNVGKHALASQVEINLHQTGNAIEMDIHDNGQGFDIQHTASGHYGLSMMRERAESVGAQLSISSQPAHGTHLSIQWTNSTSRGDLMTNSIVYPIRVMLVDDHAMVRRGLATFLRAFDDLQLAGEAASGESALRVCAETLPNVILMDMLMPGMDGVSATRLIRQQFPQVQVIVLTSYKEVELIKNALEAGAIGYLLKDVTADELAWAIRAAHSGRATLSPEVVQALVQAAKQPPDPGLDLTDRERQVLFLMVEGLSNKQIAGKLTVGQSTVKSHVSSILSKLGVENRTEAVTLAMRNHIT